VLFRSIKGFSYIIFILKSVIVSYERSKRGGFEEDDC